MATLKDPYSLKKREAGNSQWLELHDVLQFPNMQPDDYNMHSFRFSKTTALALDGAIETQSWQGINWASSVMSENVMLDAILL